MSHYNFDFSSDRGVGIQLTERQLELAETRRSHSRNADIDMAPSSHNNSTEAIVSIGSIDNRGSCRSKGLFKTSLGQQGAKYGKIDSSATFNHNKCAVPFRAANNHEPRQSQPSTVDQKALLRKVLSQKSQTSTTDSMRAQRPENVHTDNPHAVVSMEMKPLSTRSNVDSSQDTRRSKQETITGTTLFQSSSSTRRQRKTRTEYSDGYIAFLDVLKKEVAGDHTEVRVSVEKLVVHPHHVTIMYTDSIYILYFVIVALEILSTLVS